MNIVYRFENDWGDGPQYCKDGTLLKAPKQERKTIVVPSFKEKRSACNSVEELLQYYNSNEETREINIILRYFRIKAYKVNSTIFDSDNLCVWFNPEKAIDLGWV